MTAKKSEILDYIFGIPKTSLSENQIKDIKLIISNMIDRYAKQHLLDELEMLISYHEDDFDRGSGKYILRNLIELKRISLRRSEPPKQ